MGWYKEYLQDKADIEAQNKEDVRCVFGIGVWSVAVTWLVYFITSHVGLPILIPCIVAFVVSAIVFFFIFPLILPPVIFKIFYWLGYLVLVGLVIYLFCFRKGE